MSKGCGRKSKSSASNRRMPTPCTARSRRRNGVLLDQVGLFADGVAVKQVAKKLFRLCKNMVDEIVLVDTDEICAAIKDVFNDTRSILEPAGALSIAGAKAYATRHKTQRIKPWSPCQRRQHEFRPSAPRRGTRRIGRAARRRSLPSPSPRRRAASRNFAPELGPRNITEFNYRFADPKVAHVFAAYRGAERSDITQLISALKKSAS